MKTDIAQKEHALKELLQGYGSVAVAFSGGVDSALLLSVAHEVLGERAVALTATFTCFPKRERAYAKRFCEEHSIRQRECAFDAFALPGFAENTSERCYVCKKGLMSLLLETAASEGAEVLVEGSNRDDESDYRPGSVAITELGVISPLLAAGFTKADIRALAKARGLSVWDKPACACLATRLPFGTMITPELMQRIDAAEDFLLAEGARQVRVRVHGSMARIELDDKSIALFLEPERRSATDTRLRELGFDSVTLDLQGYRTGSMNAAL